MLCLFLSLSLCFVLYAQEAMTAEVLRSVDLAFSEKSSEKLATVLFANSKAPDYGELENYILKKIRQFVVLNELDFARDASLVMIDTNMENDEALAIYSSTTKAIERRTEMLLEQQRQEQQLAEKKQKEESMLAESSKVSSSYTPVVNVSSGETFYYSAPKGNYFPIQWEVALGVADLMIYTNQEETSISYGLSFGGNFFYSAEVITLGVDLFADVMLLSFLGQEELHGLVKAVPSFAINSLSDKILFRVGFLYDTGFVSPVIGASFNNKKEDGLAFDIFADYYLGHLAQENMSVAFGAGASVTFPLIQGEVIAMGLKIGLSDTVYIYDDGIENNLKCILGLKVGN